MTTTPILQVSDVRQTFRTGFLMREVEVLKGVSFSVEKKSVFGFLGPNGAGKTTLIHILAGIRRAAGGTARIGGHLAHSPEARRQIGYLPERPYFYDHLTGEQFLTYFGRLSEMSPEKIKTRIPTVLEVVGMTHARGKELRAYSKGMLQRIGIAQAILHEPELLIFDEPMSGLDPVGRKEIRELIQQLAADGQTVFFSSHIIPDVEAICDRVAIIQKGKVAGSGVIGDLLARGPLQTEVGFRGLDPGWVRTRPGVTLVREMPDGIRAIVDTHDATEGLVRDVLERQGRLLWVTPIRPSLETWFESEKTS